MKIIKIHAHSKTEAIEEAKSQGITVIRNVTHSYKESNIKNSEDLKSFCELTFDRLKINSSDKGVLIVIKPGHENTRKRPYSFINNVSKGSSIKRKIFEIKRSSDNKTVGVAYSKFEAISLAKEKIKEYKENLICKQGYQIIGNNGKVFELKYVPSINTVLGEYMIISNE